MSSFFNKNIYKFEKELPTHFWFIAIVHEFIEQPSYKGFLYRTESDLVLFHFVFCRSHATNAFFVVISPWV